MDDPALAQLTNSERAELEALRKQKKLFERTAFEITYAAAQKEASDKWHRERFIWDKDLITMFARSFRRLGITPLLALPVIEEFVIRYAAQFPGRGLTGQDRDMLVQKFMSDATPES